MFNSDHGNFFLITGRLRNNLSSGYEPLPKFIRKHILQPIIFFTHLIIVTGNVNKKKTIHLEFI